MRNITLNKLCQLYGVEREWIDMEGKRHVASAETRRALLAAMGVPVEDETVAEALAQREAWEWRRRLPSALVVRHAEPITIPLSFLRPEAEGKACWTLSLEEGGQTKGEFRPADFPITEERTLPGGSYARYSFSLPETPPLGYHQFEISTGGESESLTLIATPPACYQPLALEGHGRVWGPEIQLYTLRSSRNWGIGDFTDLKALTGIFAESGAGTVGVHPLHALSQQGPESHNPFAPSSRRFLNILYLDVEVVPEFSRCPPAQRMVYSPEFQERLERLRQTDRVDYSAVAEAKISVMELLYQTFRTNHLGRETGRGQAFRAFQAEGGKALYRHALYESLKKRFPHQTANQQDRSTWPEEYQDPESAAVLDFAREHVEEIEFHQYLLWVARNQLSGAGLRSLELGLGVGLCLGLAAGVDPAGAEAWANPELYAHGAVIGALPHELNPAGEDRGLAPLIPWRLQEAAYAPFIATLRANMQHAGALRISHIAGLSRRFWVPENTDPLQGAMVRYPFEDLLRILALESQRNHCLVIGDGPVPSEERIAMESMGILSASLLYLEKNKKGGFKPPSDFPEQALVGISSPELPTLTGYWKGQDLFERGELRLFPSDELRGKCILDRAKDRTLLLLALEEEELLPENVSADLASCPDMTPELANALHLYLTRSPARMMMPRLEDVLGQLEQARLPGSGLNRPNWRFRLSLPLEDLGSDIRITSLTENLKETMGVGVLPAQPEDSAQRETAIPRATYRLQFNREFTFADAEKLVPYLERLGVSHIYASPYLKARPGSTHGYDIIDHAAINPEIGTMEDCNRLSEALTARGMGQILDFVPNHMGVGPKNAWWMDVLENGPASIYSSFFDIDWRPFKEELRGKVLLPVLGDHYGKVLESGELKLEFDPALGVFSVRYYEHVFPLDPRTYPEILSRDLFKLEAVLGGDNPGFLLFQSLASAFAKLPARSETEAGKITERARDKEIHKRSLAGQCAACPELLRHVEGNVTLMNGKAAKGAGFSLLHHLLQAQAYRLAYWRVAADEINYRRFFDINDLAGLRMENPRVFFAAHELVTELIADGKVQGLRLDHPDGLYNPVLYYSSLRTHIEAARAVHGHTQEGREAPDLYIVSEKILASYERLPRDWPIHGTTGYEFSNLVNGWQVYAPAELAMARIYQRFIGRRPDFDDLLYQRKKLIMRVSLSSELNVLANALNRLSESDPHTRDFTLTALRASLAEVVACFPVYRTYVTDGRVTQDDCRYVDWAVAQAKKRNPAADTSVFDFIRNVLLLEELKDKTQHYRRAATDFAMRFQQYTAPLMAKGLEDTTFYVYNNLVSLNDVGGDPRRFGNSTAAIHYANQERAQYWPHAMLSTSTHDSKRSGDARSRINVLSELPEQWKIRLARWARVNRNKKLKLSNGGMGPDRSDEYLLYQTLIGAWPAGDMDEQALATFCLRVEAYMLKAVREAKTFTSWINPNQEYEQTISKFVEALLSSPGRNPFLEDFLPFQRYVSHLGMFNGLSLALLKLTSPGMPDIYQGNELWDYSLVDPDNRRPVDFSRRDELLRGLEEEMPWGNAMGAKVRALLDNMEDGRVKLFLIWRTLSLRKAQPALFRDGDYLPLMVQGAKADNMLAFARSHENESLIVAAPRWFAGLLEHKEGLPLGTHAWGDTWMELPDQPKASTYRDVFTGERVETTSHAGRPGLQAGDIFNWFPVAMLLPCE